MTSDDILSYRRTYDRDSIYVALNMSDQPANVCLADSGERPEGLILCSTGLDRQQARIPLGKVQLRPLEGLLIAGQAD
jgi:hypothetical protein